MERREEERVRFVCSECGKQDCDGHVVVINCPICNGEALPHGLICPRLVDMVAPDAPPDVPCPGCKAAPGEACKTWRGKTFLDGTIHSVRSALARCAVKRCPATTTVFGEEFRCALDAGHPCAHLAGNGRTNKIWGCVACGGPIAHAMVGAWCCSCGMRQPT